MTSPYNRINRLRRQGLTWDALGRALAAALPSKKSVIARNTLRSVHNVPHYKPGKELVVAINKVHDHYNPSCFSPGVNALMNVCRELMRKYRQEPLAREHLESLALHIEEQLDQWQLPKLIACRLYWILGNINQFNMRQARIKQAPLASIHAQQACAVHCYQSAISALDPATYPMEHYKLQHNIVVCYINAVEEKQRNSNRSLATQLASIAYIEATEQVLKTEPFQWEAARNGLLYANIIEDRRAIAYFFEALIMANQHFIDLDYKPLGSDSLLDDPSLTWAVQQVLTPTLVQTIIDVVKRKQPLSNKK